MRRALIAGVPLALLLTACGGISPGMDPAQSSQSPGTSAPPVTTAITTPPTPGALLRCDQVPLLTADRSYYRDTPKYIGNEMPIDEVRRWAARYPDFVDIWIDRDHNGWVTVAFTDEVAGRQAEIEREFPEDGVVALQIELTEEELSSLQKEVVEGLDGVVDVLGAWTDVIRGHVNLQIPVLSEENLSAIEALFPDAPICVEGLPPEMFVEPGPQLESGDGWQLIYEQKHAGFPYMTGLAWDEESFHALLDDIEGLAELDVDVDFENQVVIWFGAVFGSSCPNIRMDDVVIDGDTIFPLIVDTDNSFACTSDANPHTYLVGLDRDRLPSPPFYIQIHPDLDFDRLLVEADLRSPGSAALPNEVGPDPNPPGPEPERSGTIIEVGYPLQYEIDLTCGWEWLGEINSYQWVATSPIPESWLAQTEGLSAVTVEVTLVEGSPDPFVEVVFDGQSVIYEIGKSPGC